MTQTETVADCVRLPRHQRPSPYVNTCHPGFARAIYEAVRADVGAGNCLAAIVAAERPHAICPRCRVRPRFQLHLPMSFMEDGYLITEDYGAALIDHPPPADYPKQLVIPTLNQPIPLFDGSRPLHSRQSVPETSAAYCTDWPTPGCRYANYLYESAEGRSQQQIADFIANQQAIVPPDTEPARFLLVQVQNKHGGPTDRILELRQPQPVLHIDCDAE